MTDLTATRLRTQNRIAERQIYQTELERLAKMTAEEAAIHLNKVCRHCGSYLTPTEIDNPLRPNRKLRVWPERHNCRPAEVARKRQSEADAVAEAERIMAANEAALAKAGLTGWLRDATFDTFEPRKDWTEAGEIRRRVMAFSEAVMNLDTDKTFLVLHGQFGSGKSHLAAAVIRQFIDAGWKNCYFRNWSEYLLRIQATFNRRDGEDGETESDIIQELQAGGIVVIDDLDKRKPSEWVRSVLYPVLNHRYNNRMPTILTFNYAPTDVDPQAPGRAALEAYLGRAVIDRIIGSAFDVIEFDGASYRSKVRWQ